MEEYKAFILIRTIFYLNFVAVIQKDVKATLFYMV